MASIKFSDLHPAGSDFFSDSESYMRELSDTELALQGGSFVTWIRSAATSAVSAIGNAISAIGDAVVSVATEYVETLSKAFPSYPR